MRSRGFSQPVLGRAGAAFVMLALAFAAAAPAALAQAARLLGETRLSFHENDLDILAFGACQSVTAIKLRARRGAAEINLLVVKYGNGAVDRLPVRHRIPEGGETRWIDLRGTRRCVTSIAVVGDTERSADRTIIQFWGR
jgi:hypothetical protein